MPIKITDLVLIEELEACVSESLIEARVDSSVLTTIRNRFLDLRIEFMKLLTEGAPDELPQNVIINNYITSPARNAK